MQNRASAGFPPAPPSRPLVAICSRLRHFLSAASTVTLVVDGDVQLLESGCLMNVMPLWKLPE